MNFVKYKFFVAPATKKLGFFCLFLIVLLSIYLAGCSDEVRLTSAEQLTEFEYAGPIRPTIDLDCLVRAKIGKMSYRIVPGDVLAGDAIAINIWRIKTLTSLCPYAGNAKSHTFYSISKVFALING